MSDVFVKNPHSILAALRLRPRDVLEVSFPRDKNDDVWDEIEVLCVKNKVRQGQGQKPSTGGRTQHVLKEGGRDSGHGALIKPKQPIAIEELFSKVGPNSREVWLALDSLQDTQNLGAIFRSAAFFGIKGIVITSERSAPMTAVVYDIACGGVESVPYVSVINLQRAFEKAKDAGLWILGTSEHAKDKVQNLKKDRPWLLVVGNEEKGIRVLTEKSCDMMCTIPAGGKDVTSLNVSVATGILLSHLV